MASLDDSHSGPYRIAVIPGDGIGPELVDSAQAVLDAVTSTEDNLSLAFTREYAGADAYLNSGENIDAETLQRLQDRYDGILKGPVGLPDVRRPDGTEAGLLGGVLRTRLDTYANVRPVHLLDGAHTPVTHAPGTIDYVIVRENTEGLYASRGNGVGNQQAASDIMFMTRYGIERVVHFAFTTARRRHRSRPATPRVTCVDKSNVLKSFALFRAVFDEVAASYPDVETDHLYADAAAQALVTDPARFDVLVMENFLGDVLSDLGAATAGGLGMCPAGNVGKHYAYFEPVHGSAPRIAGTNQANPTSQILAAGMLLEHLGEASAAQRVREGVAAAYGDGAIRLDDVGRPECMTTGVTRAVLDRL